MACIEHLALGVALFCETAMDPYFICHKDGKEIDAFAVAAALSELYLLPLWNTWKIIVGLDGW